MKILVGKIVKPQGCKGELKVYPADNNVEIYKNVGYIYFENSDEKVKLNKICVRQDFVYITIDGLTDRTKAESYRNKKIFTDEEQIKLKQNTYFVDDLMNADVYFDNGEFLGNIVDVESYGAADVLTILDNSKRECKIPFLTNVVNVVSKDKIIVNKQKYNEVKVDED